VTGTYSSGNCSGLSPDSLLSNPEGSGFAPSVAMLQEIIENKKKNIFLIF
jgi:hypothetical protein